MHIAHVIMQFSPKLKYQEHYLIERQIKDGHKVTVLTSEWNPSFPNYDGSYKSIIGEKFVGAGLFREASYDVVRLPLYNNPTIFSRLKGLNKILRALSPEMIICHGESGLICVQCAMTGIPTIIDCHYVKLHDEMFPQKNKAKKKARFYVDRIKSVILRGLKVKYVGVTEESIEHLLKTGVPLKDIQMIPLAIDEAAFSFSADFRTETRKSFGLKENDFLIITTGKIEEYKGTHLILEAAFRLGKKDVFILIVGNGRQAYMASLARFCDDNGLSKNVFFHKYAEHDELLKLFCAADIAVYPKSISISHIEAMSVGLPIIVCDMPAIRHRIEYGNGFSVASDDVSDLVVKIEKLYSNLYLRKEMGSKSRQLVEDKLNVRVMNQQFFKIFSEICS